MSEKEGYELTEEQLLELYNILEEKRKPLLKHPESPDNVAILQLQNHVLNRLNQIVWQKYKAEKGIKLK